MKTYSALIVTLREFIEDRFLVTFECKATDVDHAELQAEKAYPAYKVINITQIS